MEKFALTFDSILEKHRTIAFSQRDKGYRFERLMQAFLKTDPRYASLFDHIWLWKDFEGKYSFGQGQDVGIDLVAITYGGEYWAIQCKCFSEDSTITKSSVDSFLATSSRTFKDQSGKTTYFSQRLWISTSNNWSTNATEAIKNQHPPVTRINISDLRDAFVDWEKLEKGLFGEESRIPKKTIREHQREAIEKTHDYFKEHDRGKLIMACGTGKTFTALKIAEKETDEKGLVLFLVPSIALMSQTLREWSADANQAINAICICSDPKVSSKKVKNDDNADTFSVVDLALPASTNIKDIVHQLAYIKKTQKKGMTVVFSTYQSIDVISEAQKSLFKQERAFGEFDLIICDEAHRTTGVTLSGEDESAFVKVHDNSFIKAKKRLYMTATPRLYNENSKSKAAQADAVLCSMDDPKLYGEETYRIGFGEAVEKNLLTDYKVLILTLNEKDVPSVVQEAIAASDYEINTDDVTKLIGCINALSKQIHGDEGSIQASDPEPMRKAVAFCQSIATSKIITNTYNTIATSYLDALPLERKDQMAQISSKHIDGNMTAPERDELMSWLKAESDNNECRILTNVRCLSEGVDVPSLDSVMFLSARNSQIDVVQSVGRVMRIAPGKKYGYIIIPIIIPSEIDPNIALDDNERYKVVWTVLNALRAHDDRFNAVINKIELNKKKPERILVGHVPDYKIGSGTEINHETPGNYEPGTPISNQLGFQFEQLQHIVFARMVEKVGDRRYWEQWAKSVGEIAERQTTRIKCLVEERIEHNQAFEEFLSGLQKNINPSVTKQEAIEMLSQHTVTKPVFEALFEDYSFVRNNPISLSMQKMLDLLEDQSLEEDIETLQKFYESVSKRASGIDNAEGKQRIIIELYDKFFKTAFPKMVERLGIVYTPVEIVDFIIHSVNDVLKKEFDRSIGDENIHILDPFTGTGTFITRLIQSGLIDPEKLSHKYQNEIHANEIVLLAYYIATVNIENAFHDATNQKDYTPFEGICLTDTFQLTENSEGKEQLSVMFPQNSARVQKQKNTPLRVIIGNPPYSIGQKSANDNAQNQVYSNLTEKIALTYAKHSKASLSKSLYDSYIKAFRWSTDRLDKNGGIICFVSNGAWLDGNSTDGFRKCLEKDFTSIYVLNLRGNQRTSGELSRKEGGKIFGSGSRTPIAITLLVKNPKDKRGKANIYYHDIGDYLSREEKLSKVKKYVSVSNPTLKWITLKPNDHGDWISQRSSVFESFIPLAPEKKYNPEDEAFFHTYAIGIATNRDAWVYNFSQSILENNMATTINFYNDQAKICKLIDSSEPSSSIDEFIDCDHTKISWTVNLKKDLEKGQLHSLKQNTIITAIYRPFCKQHLYFDKPFIERPGLFSKLFPTAVHKNLVIVVSGTGHQKEFSIFITDKHTDLQVVDKCQCFPLYYFTSQESFNIPLFDSVPFIRNDAISDFALDRAKKQYGNNVTKEDIFYYVYGFLHCKEYKEIFAADLKKMLPRIPLVDDVRDFWAFSKAGRKLANLHISYEEVPAFDGVNVSGAESSDYHVEQMRFFAKDRKDTILYNNKISISNIPAKAYEYVVNGRSAIEWIMERYQITVHKESGIKNDPNDWAREVGNPRYILDLLLSIINVSLQTVEIVEGLPKLKFEEEGLMDDEVN